MRVGFSDALENQMSAYDPKRTCGVSRLANQQPERRSPGEVLVRSTSLGPARTLVRAKSALERTNVPRVPRHDLSTLIHPQISGNSTCCFPFVLETYFPASADFPARPQMFRLTPVSVKSS
jgi:hypothetical protein